MQYLLDLDSQLLLDINGRHNAILDTFLWNVSSKYVWILYIC